MPDVRLPDGTVVKNVPEGMTQADLMRRIQQSRGVPMPSMPTPDTEAAASPEERNAIARGAGQAFLHNMLGIPDLAFTAGARMLTGQPLVEPPFANALAPEPANAPQPPVSLPQVGERVIPGIPTGQQAVAGIETAGRVAANPSQIGQVGQQFQQSMQHQQQAQQQQPGAFAVGETLGDIGTLVSGRLPFARSVTRAGGRAPRISNERAAATIETIAKEQPQLARQAAELVGSARLATPGATRLWKRLIESDAVSSLGRGLGKSFEAGLEGAVLAALQENDPAEVAGMAAGGQALASMLGTTLGIPTSMKGLVTRAVGYTVLLRFAQEFGPGENNLFTASDTVFDKLKWGLIVGTASQVAGGRFRGAPRGRMFAEDLPRVADTINAIPRGALISLANRVQGERDSGETTTIETLEILQNNPESLGRDFARRLDRAMQNGRLAEEIGELSDNPMFLRRLEEFDQ